MKRAAYQILSESHRLGWEMTSFKADHRANVTETYFSISSVILWELSILPRSASNESAAEDLYALPRRESR